MSDLRKIGTIVKASDGFTERFGQVVDHETNRWGTFHVVVFDGKFEHVMTIGDENKLGIGFKVASQSEIEFMQRSRERESNRQQAGMED